MINVKLIIIISRLSFVNLSFGCYLIVISHLTLAFFAVARKPGRAFVISYL